MSTGVSGIGHVFCRRKSRVLAVFDTAGEHDGYTYSDTRGINALVQEMGFVVLDQSLAGFDVRDTPPA